MESIPKQSCPSKNGTHKAPLRFSGGVNSGKGPGGSSAFGKQRAGKMGGYGGKEPMKIQRGRAGGRTRKTWS